MAKFSMCKNESCPSKDTCYRYTAVPERRNQYYGKFEPESDKLDKCGYYWKDRRLDELKKGLE